MEDQMHDASGTTTKGRARRRTSGEPYVWLSASALTISLLITALLMYVVVTSGLGFFWQKPLERVSLADGSVLLGEVSGQDVDPVTGEKRFQYKVGNVDWYGEDFVWVDSSDIIETALPREAIAFERIEDGRFFGFLDSVDAGGVVELESEGPWERLVEARSAIGTLEGEIAELAGEMKKVTQRSRVLRDRIKRVEYRGVQGRESKYERLRTEDAELMAQLDGLLERSVEKEVELAKVVAKVSDVSGQTGTVEVAHIVRAFQPNRMETSEKLSLYGSRVWELLTEEPRESNTAGGLFPAIFGTVFLVFLMSLFCVPLGVVAAVYLHEYAKDGFLVRCVRIAVNNLAGVPSIVYGIFGLGFFVYFVGGHVDDLFFAHRLPEPTWGTGGVLWASLTLALLTVPVVIVSTEEGLSAIPGGIREGSVGLGATKLQTLTRVLLPMASPGIMTGFVLSMARAAGEVAPLMLLGVVKLAPTLPMDGEFPYMHLDRKFMHLGFHIYDVGFQSPNVEAVRPMVYVTTMLLLALVVLLSLVAIVLRNRMRKKYTTSSF